MCTLYQIIMNNYLNKCVFVKCFLSTIFVNAPDVEILIVNHLQMAASPRIQCRSLCSQFARTLRKIREGNGIENYSFFVFSRWLVFVGVFMRRISHSW